MTLDCPTHAQGGGEVLMFWVWQASSPLAWNLWKSESSLLEFCRVRVCFLTMSQVVSVGLQTRCRRLQVPAGKEAGHRRQQQEAGRSCGDWFLEAGHQQNLQGNLNFWMLNVGWGLQSNLTKSGCAGSLKYSGAMKSIRRVIREMQSSWGWGNSVWIEALLCDAEGPTTAQMRLYHSRWKSSTLTFH